MKTKKLYPCFLCHRSRNKCADVLCASCIAALDAASPTLKRANKGLHSDGATRPAEMWVEEDAPDLAKAESEKWFDYGVSLGIANADDDPPSG